MSLWHSSSTVGCINEVTVGRAQLVLGWVTVFGRVYHIGMQLANLVNSALHPSRVAKSSTIFGWGNGGNDILAR